MRTAHVIGKMKYAGVENVVFSYVGNITDKSCETDIIYDADSTASPPRSLVGAGVRFIPCVPYQHFFRYMRDLVRIFREGQYDIVHSHMNALSVFPLIAAKLAGIKIRIAHNHTTSSRQEFGRNLIKSLLRPFSRLLATDYVACSDKAACWMFTRSAVEHGRVRILVNAIDTERFCFNALQRESVRRQLGVGEKKVIGHIGRFMSTKNHPFIIDIFSQVSHMSDAYVLLLIGDGEDIDKIREMTKKAGLDGKVIFTGALEDTAPYYQAMDVFILPSLYEGMPVCAIEAESAGLPCVISDKVTDECSLTPHVQFLPIDSPEKWARSIMNIGQHDRSADGAAMMKSRYNIKNSANELCEYYKELMTKRGGE